ncbi:DUF732 domain-containing protein [Mycobacterium sp. Marseille-P9652]|uniref:DUF732 domain-containing protein n=1 Tax=Mycobacterium sp. Marseille-P9652 TaxID=2654950 RepID=UPI0012E7D988|nr:DUF732 domain-containing protein [Mycobacterium sp. Marseille-P9652]
MRDRETIDSELRRIASGRRSIQEIDALLDERLGHRVEASVPEVVAARDVPDITPFRPRRVLRRFGLLAALPLSLIAGAACVVMMTRDSQPAAEPAAAPPPAAVAPSAAPPVPPPPQAPPTNIVDSAFVDVLRHNGVTVPSQEYVTAHGHAVCEFLTHQDNLADAVRFVQQSSIWDADQSANFTAGAIVSYCPQYQNSGKAEIQPGYQGALSDLQNVQHDLQGIEGDLQRIRDALPTFPGQQ